MLFYSPLRTCATAMLQCYLLQCSLGDWTWDICEILSKLLYRSSVMACNSSHWTSSLSICGELVVSTWLLLTAYDSQGKLVETSSLRRSEVNICLKIPLLLTFKVCPYIFCTDDAAVYSIRLLLCTESYQQHMLCCMECGQVFCKFL